MAFGRCRANNFLGYLRVKALMLAGLEGLFDAAIFPGVKSENGNAATWVQAGGQIPQESLQGGELVVNGNP
jgi:hypothetical protein